jgi:zinc protease
MDEYVDKVLAITPEQIQTVAQKYLVEDQLTVAELVPQPIDQSKPRFAPTFVR